MLFTQGAVQGLRSGKMNKGFTLIELMIVVAIIGVLAAIAYPSYQNSIRKAHRIEAQADLMDIAKKIQRYKIANFTYLQPPVAPSQVGLPITLTNIGETIPLTIPRQGQALYTITLTDVGTNTWTLTATPINNTTQQLDGVLSTNHRGEKCWVKGASTCVLSATSNWDGR